MTVKTELHHDNFQNFKRYNIPRAQLVIADIPYNIGKNAYGSNPVWYVGGDNKNGESEKAKAAFFNGDGDFNLEEYFHFCGKLLKKEPKETDSSEKESDLSDSFPSNNDAGENPFFSSENENPDSDEEDDDLFPEHITIDEEDQLICDEAEGDLVTRKRITL
jgi:hypothetical protein